MKIDLNHYVLSKKFIQETFINKHKDDPAFAISFMSAVTHVPIIVASFFVSEVDGWSEKTIEIINNIIKFYDYKEIMGIPENFPKDKLKI